MFEFKEEASNILDVLCCFLSKNKIERKREIKQNGN
jgi:hypothetical protein